MNVPNYSEGGTRAEDESARDYFNIPDYKSEMDDAKTFLQKVSPFTGDNIYDHLSEVLNKILAERPENVIDFFEEYSRKVKEQRFKPLTDHLKDIYISPAQYEYTMKIMPYLKPLLASAEEPSTVDPADEDILDPDKRDLLKICFFFEKAGISLPRPELYCLEISMRNLAKSEKLEDIRFWGKIYGLYKNYIILETELSEEDIEKRNQIPEKEEEEQEENAPVNEVDDALAKVAREQEQYGEGAPLVKSKIPRPLPPVPVSHYTPFPETPVEPSGEGVNKKVYYVCNEIGDTWVQLPDVTPQQIVVARKIVKHFTGNLDTEIISYPKFPGNETNYLRAQIARISAGTQISPLGYFTFKGGEVGGEEEEEEEEVEEEEEGGGAKTNYKLNTRYEPHPMNDLTDMSMSFWVHHTQYILPQGRTKWWNPNPKSFEGGGEEMGEEEEEEEDDKGIHAEPETGPGLLTPLSGDASLEAVPAWTVRCTSALLPEHAAAVVSSNLWPGAFGITCGKFMENLYIGNGQKHYAHNFSPAPLPHIQEEYPMGPEVMEMTDPTANMEEAWRIAHEKPPPPLKLEGEEEEEEEEEEEDEEDDDEDDEDDD